MPSGRQPAEDGNRFSEEEEKQLGFCFPWERRWLCRFIKRVSSPPNNKHHSTAFSATRSIERNEKGRYLLSRCDDVSTVSTSNLIRTSSFEVTRAREIRCNAVAPLKRHCCAWLKKSAQNTGQRGRDTVAETRASLEEKRYRVREALHESREGEQKTRTFVPRALPHVSSRVGFAATTTALATMSVFAAVSFCMSKLLALIRSRSRFGVYKTVSVVGRPPPTLRACVRACVDTVRRGGADDSSLMRRLVSGPPCSDRGGS